MKTPTIFTTYVRSAARPWLGPASVAVVASTFHEAVSKTRQLLRREWRRRRFALGDTLEMRMPHPDHGRICCLGSIEALIA